MEKEESRSDDTIRFHYDREERLKRLSSELYSGTSKGGILKGNRSLIILLLDVVLIVMIYAIISYFTGGENTYTIGGYSFSFKGFIFESEVHLSIKITCVEEPENTGREIIENNLVEVVFSVKGTDIKEKVVDLLPEGKGETRIVREKLDIGTSNPVVYADISFGDKKLRLSTRIKPE